MNLRRLNALVLTLRLAFMVAALCLLLACDVEDPTSTTVPTPTTTPSPTTTPVLTAAPNPTATPGPTAAPTPTTIPESEMGENEFTFEFTSDSEGRVVGFADLPVNYDQSIYELGHDHRPLPDGLEGGIYVQGHNRSDDLFMFLKRRVDGLRSDTTYAVSVSANLATNVPAGLVGIGGSPGESVYVKAGASTSEPLAVEDETGHLRMNIDKGNQATDGEAMVVLGDVAHDEVSNSEYRIKTLDNADLTLRVTTDSEGRAWLIVGTDSGFEGLTQLYYARISYVLAPE